MYKMIATASEWWCAESQSKDKSGCNMLKRMSSSGT